MQIRKCVLIEMFSLVLIGMFSPFFHIIGSRIGAFGLFPFLDGDTISLFDGDVLTCHVSLNFGGTHTTACARAHGPGLRRACGAAWMDPSRENFAAQGPGPRPHRPQTARREPGTNPAAAAQPRTRRGAATARPAARRRSRRTTGHRRVPGGAARPRPRLPATACARRARRAHRVRAARPRWGRRTRRRSERGGAAGARAMNAARATSSARVIMHVGSPDAARAQDVASRWSRRARSWRRACRDGRSHRGRGARPHDRARRDKRDGQRDGVEPRGRRHRG